MTSNHMNLETKYKVVYVSCQSGCNPMKNQKELNFYYHCHDTFLNFARKFAALGLYCYLRNAQLLFFPNK